MSSQHEAAGPFSIAAFDLDGTLTDPLGAIDTDVLKEVRELKHRGVLVVIATARGPSGVTTIVAALGGCLGVVTYQGALVGSFDDGRWVTHTETTLGIEVAHQIVDLAAESGLTTSWHAGLSWYTTALSEEVLVEASIVNDSPQLVEDHRQLTAPPHKLMIISSLDETRRLKDLTSRLPTSVSHSYSHRNYLEVSPSGVDKGTGLHALITRMGGGAGDLAAFGDAENDLAMFEVAAHSVVMAHAPAAVRDAATSVAGNGLVSALQQIRWRPFDAVGGDDRFGQRRL